MKFNFASLAAIGCVLPPRIITSQEIESRLQPLYERLSLPTGRLELASGIRQRRVWNAGERISDGSIAAAQAALDVGPVAAKNVQALIHASVCREFLEPATACRVHYQLGLSSQAFVYDVSNACLGMLNGAVQIASLIEAEVISAGIVVGTENSLGLMESTIATLNQDLGLTRKSIKGAFASLTIGSGACAWLIVDRRKYGGGPLDFAVAIANTKFSDLCISNEDKAGAAMQPLMETDSEKLLEAGIQTGADAFANLLAESNFRPESFGSSVSHQVGHVHRRSILERLHLPLENDFATFDWLGNTGSVALPTALAVALDHKAISKEKPTALLGIGSGINSVMLAARLTDVSVKIVDRNK